MIEYHKIHSVWKRDKRGVFVEGDWSRPEFCYLADLPWRWTEKVDGTNIRIGLDVEPVTADNGEEIRTFCVGGRTESSQIPARLLGAIDALGLPDKLRSSFSSGPVTLYGEGYGAKIQKGGGNYRQDQGFVLFDVRIGRWWLNREDVEDVGASLGLDVVPEVMAGLTLSEAIDVFRGLADDIDPEHMGGLRSAWGPFRAEGVVGTPMVPLFARDGSRVVVKLKHKDFDRLVLKQEEGEARR